VLQSHFVHSPASRYLTVLPILQSGPGGHYCDAPLRDIRAEGAKQGQPLSAPRICSEYNLRCRDGSHVADRERLFLPLATVLGPES
jgi:hypothetical protein